MTGHAVTAIHTKDGNLLFNEATGSDNVHSRYDDKIYFDTDSGKWYRSVFDIEMSFWASKFYYAPFGSGTSDYDDNWPKYDPVQPCFKSQELDIVGLMKDVAPVLTLDNDWTVTVTYDNVMPSPYQLEIK